MKKFNRKIAETRPQQLKIDGSRLRAPLEAVGKILAGKLRAAFELIRSAPPLLRKAEALRSSGRSEEPDLVGESKRRSRSMLTEDRRQLTQEEILAVLAENCELKRMALSEETRSSLLRVQKFERGYHLEGERQLRAAIPLEVRRLERLKNEADEMRWKFYDNELTVTCLHNFLRALSQIGAQQAQLDPLAARAAQLEARITEMTMQHRKEVADYKKKIMLIEFSQSRRKATSEPLIAPDNASATSQTNNCEQQSEDHSHHQQIATLNAKLQELQTRIHAQDAQLNQLQHEKRISEEIRAQNVSLKQEIETLKLEAEAKEQRSGELTPRALLSDSKSSVTDADKQRARELQDFLGVYEAIQEKRGKQTSYQRQLNELRVLHPQSPLLHLLEAHLDLQSANLITLRSLRDVVSLFTEGAWKRRSRILLKEEGEVFTCINEIIMLLLALSKEKQIYAKSQTELEALKKKCKVLTEENTEVKLSLKEFQTQLSKKKGGSKRNGEGKDNSNSQEPILSNLDKANLTIECLSGQISKLRGQLLQGEREEKGEERLASYKLLYENIKMERDNLRLLLEEKNEEYEISKENEERYEELKRRDHQLIAELYAQLEAQNIRERQTYRVFEQEASELKENYRRTEARSQEFLRKIDTAINQRNEDQKFKEMYEAAHADCNRLQSQLSNFANQKGSIIAQLQDNLKRAELENRDLIAQLDNQRQIFREKLAELNSISEAASRAMESEKQEKAELRRQAEQRGKELAACVRSSESEKRESRAYVEQLQADLAAQAALHAQERHLLQASVEQARTEEYEINQQKIKQLRAEVQGLCAENQRLIEIIDCNEAPFNQLVQEHQQLSQELMDLQEERKQLLPRLETLLGQREQHAQALSSSERENAQLQASLRQLQERIIHYQSQISGHLQLQSTQDEACRTMQTSIAELTKTNSELRSDNQSLHDQHSSHLRQISQLQSQLGTLQAQLHTQKQHHITELDLLRTRQGEYTAFLEAELNKKASELQQLSQKQSALIGKVQAGIITTNELEKEKQSLLLMAASMEAQIKLERDNAAVQQAAARQLLGELNQVLNRKDSQILELRSNCVDSSIVEQLVEEKRSLSLKVDKLMDQNNCILKAIQQAERQSAANAAKLQEESRRTMLENKHLLSSIAMLRAQLKDAHSQYLESHSKVVALQTQAQRMNCASLEASQPQDWTSHPLTEEVASLRTQLQAKQEQVAKLRFLNFSLQVKFSEAHRRVAELEAREEKHLLEAHSYQEAKLNLSNAQDAITRLQHERKFAEEGRLREIQLREGAIAALQASLGAQAARIEEQEAQLSAGRVSERHLLLQIVRQLDYNCRLDGEPETIRTLQNISQRVAELVQANQALKDRCYLLAQAAQEATAELESSVAASLRQAVHDLLGFLVANHLIAADQAEPMPSCDIDRLAPQLAAYLMHLFSLSSKQAELEISRYNNVIRDIRALIEQAQASRDLQSLASLLELLRHAEV